MKKNNHLDFSFILLYALLILILVGCNQGSYNMADFKQVGKIDVHVHFNSTNPAYIDQAQTDNFKLLTINTDYADFPPIAEQLRIAVELIKLYPGRITYASTFYMTGWDESDWQERTIKHLDSTFAAGAIAVKFWKNIGMAFTDKNGKMVMIDDPKFDPIFAHLQQIDIPVIGHQGEPKECWLPFEQMRIKDLKDYYKQHPQYHMYLHPEMPSYEQQMDARDNMLEKNRDMVFMAAHLASLEWSVDDLAKFFDRFPRAVADMGARMSQLQYQSSRDREKVRQFLIKYQDRILYATDIPQDADVDSNAADFKKSVHGQWINDWKYLCTDSTMISPDFEQSFTGLKLPKEVVDKIYRLNAEKTFPTAWKVAK